MEKIRQELRQIFLAHGLKTTIEKPNLPAVNFLDVTFDLENEIYKPFRKPNDRPLYVHRHSNHPPSVLRAIPKSINKRLTSISSSAREFNRAKGDYQEALDNSGYNFVLEYNKPDTPDPPNPRNQANDRRRSQISQLSQRSQSSQRPQPTQTLDPHKARTPKGTNARIANRTSARNQTKTPRWSRKCSMGRTAHCQAMGPNLVNRIQSMMTA